jgi:hypothetical protein
VLEDFLNRPVTLFLELNQRYQNFRSGMLGWPAEALIEVGGSYQSFYSHSTDL